MSFDLSIIAEYWPLVLRGAGLTVAAFAIALVFSLVLGGVVALARLSRWRALAWSAQAYIEVVRNLPFMIILFLIFYVLPFYGPRLSAFVLGVIALVVYGGAYFAEIIRAAIQSVPSGQLESARAVGMSRMQGMRHVVFPQMMGFFLPPATNQAVMIVKESSILSTITVFELTMAGQVIQGYTYSPMEVFLMISILYWVVCSAISRAGARLERVLQPYLRPRPAVAPAQAIAVARSAVED